MNALAKPKLDPITEVPYPAASFAPLRASARVVPLIVAPKPEKKLVALWSLLGAVAFVIGAASANVYMNQGPRYFHVAIDNMHMIEPIRTESDAYAETVYPPPSDVVVPVPVTPVVLNEHAQPISGNVADFTAGIALPVSSVQAFSPPASKAKHAAAVVAAAEPATKSEDAPRITVQSEASADDLKLLDDAQTKLDADENNAALAIYNRILAHSHDNRAALTGKAFVLQRVGKYEAAADANRRLLKLDEKDDDARANLAVALGAWGSSPAIAELKRMVAKTPDFAPAQAALAVAYTHRGNALAALPYAREATKLDQENARYMLDLAIVYDHLGHSGEAVKYYKQALDAYNVADGSASDSLAQIEQRLGYLEKLMTSAAKLASK